MNIFLTSYNHKEAASHLDDLRLNKMILETAQLLSSAYRKLFEPHDLLYKDTHLNHPCTLWVSKDVAHYSWLVDYFDALAQEKRERDLFLKKYLRMHQSWLCLFKVFELKKAKYDTPIFDFNCTEFKSEADVRVAYQKQLVKKWQADFKIPKWTARTAPDFFKNASI